MNNFIAVKDPEKRIHMADMIRWVSVVLLSILSDVTYDK